MTSNEVDGSIIGELLLDELPEWRLGVCRIEVEEGDGEEEEDIVVFGEGDHEVGRVTTDRWKKPEVPEIVDQDEVKALGEIAEQVNRVIKKEHANL